MSHLIRRRKFLIDLIKASAAVGIAPYLSNLNIAQAQAANYKYFIAIMPHSLALLFPQRPVTIHNNFFAGYGNWQFQGRGSLSEFDAIRANLLVPRGLTNEVSGGLVGHFLEQGGFLTGYPTRGASSYDLLLAGADNTSGAPAGTQSIDWMIAQAYGFQPLALGFSDRGYNEAEAPHFFRAISWSSPTSAQFPVFDSKALLALLKTRLDCNSFFATRSSAATRVSELQQEIKLFSLVEKEYTKRLRVDRSYSSEFDQYIQDFRNKSLQLSQNVESLSSGGSALAHLQWVCDWSGPAYSSPHPPQDEGYYLAKCKELGTLATKALQSRVTNAVTLSIVLDQNHHRMHYISDLDVGRDGNSHEAIISHGEGVKRYMGLAAQAVIHLVNELKTAGLFQDTLILFGGEQNDGNTHTAQESPVLIIDGKNPGWHGANVGTLSSNGQPPRAHPYSSLLVDILSRFGISRSNFGSPYNIRGVGNRGIF